MGLRPMALTKLATSSWMLSSRIAQMCRVGQAVGTPNPLFITVPIRDHINANEIFTPTKLNKAIRSMGLFKAPGPDGLSPIVLSHMGPKALERLLNRYKISHCLGYVPQSWQHAAVICLPKPGKSKYNEARHFRPITLANVLFVCL